VVNNSTNLLPSTHERANGLPRVTSCRWGVPLLCGFGISFQKFTLRQSELLDEVVNVVLRVILTASPFCWRRTVRSTAAARTADKDIDDATEHTFRSHRARYPSWSCPSWVNSLPPRPKRALVRTTRPGRWLQRWAAAHISGLRHTALRPSQAATDDSALSVAPSLQNRRHVLIRYGSQRPRGAAACRSRSPRSRSAHPGGYGHLVESWPARLVGERPAGMAGRVRGADGRQRWIRAVDLRPASGE
jgi:hypothetical protein